jgi:hypothetical protein
MKIVVELNESGEINMNYICTSIPRSTHMRVVFSNASGSCVSDVSLTPKTDEKQLE